MRAFLKYIWSKINAEKRIKNGTDTKNNPPKNIKGKNTATSGKSDEKSSFTSPLPKAEISDDLNDFPQAKSSQAVR